MKQVKSILAIAAVFALFLSSIVSCNSGTPEGTSNTPVNTSVPDSTVQTSDKPYETEDVSADVTSEENTKETSTSEEITSIISENTTEVQSVVTEPQHTHVFTTTWTNDSSKHWKECTCGEKIESAIHTFSDWNVTKESSCSETGEKKRSCTVCGYTETVVVEKLAHTSISDAAVAPTCTETGLTAGSHCSVCGAVIIKQETISATGHSFGEWTVSKEATCTEKGTESRTCSICGANDNRDITEFGHNYIATVVPPTKTEPGYTTHKCSRCGNSYNDAIVEATGSIGLAYTDNGNGTCTITGIGDCTDTDIIVPNKINNLTVVEIGEKAFENQTTITSVIIPDTITKIGNRAYHGCTNLIETNISKSVAEIGSNVFLDSGITLIRISSDKIPANPNPQIVTGFSSIFEGTDLKKIVFDVKRIPDFFCTGITSLLEVEFTNKLKSIGEEAFYGCSGITCITIPSSVNEIKEGAFSGCTSLERINIPDGIKKLNGYTFSNCSSLTKVDIPDSVISFGGGDFSGCTSLKTITLPKGVIEIPEHTFSSCYSLVSVTIPDSVEKIIGSFSNCNSMTDVYYQGTISDWGFIDKWTYEYGHLFESNSISDIAIIHCTDGDIMPTDQ